MSLWDDLMGYGFGSIVNGQQQQAQQSQSLEMRVYQGSLNSIPPSDYEKAIMELDREFPSINESWQRYVEPLWLRFLRWIVHIL